MHVRTCCHPDQDAVAVEVDSPLVAAGRLAVFLDFPYADQHEFAEHVGTYGEPDAHQTTGTTHGNRADITHRMDSTKYHVAVTWQGRGVFASAAANGGDLVIRTAQYGTDGHWADVAAKLAELIVDDSLTALVDYRLLGDPAPGQAKRLVLAYTYGGRDFEIVVRDNETLSIGAAASRHRYRLAAADRTDRLHFVCTFAPAAHSSSPQSSSALASPAATFAASGRGWRQYWLSGGAVDLSESKDPRWHELERRIVLSQYLLRANEAGSLPPQESGLVNNSWHGKFHMEMYWWHGAHWALWNRWPILERSLTVFDRFQDSSRERAQKQGFRGARWPKCTTADGSEAPHVIHALLMWQQPHPIFLAELDYQAHPTKATLRKWRDIVADTADFLASWAFWDVSTSRYVLGPPMHLVSENTDPKATQNLFTGWRFSRTWGWDFPMLAMCAARLGRPDDAVDFLLHPSGGFQFDDAGLATGGPPLLPEQRRPALRHRVHDRRLARRTRPPHPRIPGRRPLGGAFRGAGTGPVMTVTELFTEYADNPLGVDVPRPRLAWLLESDRPSQSQSAYQLVVASSESLLARDRADVWDSGKVASAQSAGVPYDGPALVSGTRYHWKVRCWDKDGHGSPWSDAAWWETGVLDEADWAGAQWIGAPPAAVTGGPLLRKDFTVAAKVERARVHLSGLGYHVLTIDGVRVGDSVLDPGVTVYDKTALYATHDVTSLVAKRGPHALGVALGRGFYGLPPGDTKWWGSAPWLGDPRLWLKLEIDYTDGHRETVVSDPSWQIGSGPTTRDSVYLDETYDSRLVQPGWDRAGFDASSWHLAVQVTAPTPNLRSQPMQPIRVVDTLRAAQITNPKPGTYVFKYPVVTAGWARLRVSGAAGTEITLRYGETLRADGIVDNSGDAGLTNGPVQTDRYVLRGQGQETWEPSFSYKGFQYVQADGYPGVPGIDDVTARVVHSDVPATGTFSSSHSLLNTIHEISRRTFVNNLHSVMTDTPVFEKRGWLGDVNVLLPATIDNYGMHRFYRNWLHSMRDNQAPDGAGVEVSPNPFPAGYTDPIWAGALVDIPWQLFQDYGDRDVLEASYGSMKRYVDYLTSRSDSLIQEGFYGDWVSPATSGTFPWPPEGAQLTATADFHRYAEVLAQAAAELGHGADAVRFGQLAERIKAAFNARFLDRSAGRYRTDRDVGYRQTSNAVPLSFGLVPAELVAEVTRQLVADIRAHGNHLNTGHAGTKELLPALTAQGHVDLALTIATQRTYPSWGFWIENGATRPGRPGRRTPGPVTTGSSAASKAGSTVTSPESGRRPLATHRSRSGRTFRPVWTMCQPRSARPTAPSLPGGSAETTGCC